MNGVLFAAAVTVIRVLSPSGAPAAGAQVVCGGDVAAAVTTDGAGTARAPAGCTAPLCTKGDLAGVADAGSRTCRLRPAALSTLSPVPDGCAPPDGCVASLVLHGLTAPLVRVAARTGDTRWRFPPLPPGFYEAEVRRAADGWTCAGPLDVSEGRAVLAATWREPRPLHGRVIGAADGAARAGVRVDARVLPRGSSSRRSWTCSAQGGSATSDGQGNFRVLVDPGARAVVSAGGVSVERDGAQTEETLYLEVP